MLQIVVENKPPILLSILPLRQCYSAIAIGLYTSKSCSPLNIEILSTDFAQNSADVGMNYALKVYLIVKELSCCLSEKKVLAGSHSGIGIENGKE